MKRGVFIFWTLFIGVALTRIFFSFNRAPPDIGSCLKQTVQGVGIVQDEPERKESGQVFIVRTDALVVRSDSLDMNGALCASHILIRLKAKLYPRFEYGDSVSFTGKLSKPFNFQSDTGRSFDYEGYLAKDDVFYEVKSASVGGISPVAAASERGRDPGIFSSLPAKISAGLFYLKRGFVSNLERVLGEPHAALASGLVVGEKSALGSDLLDDFRTVGLIHIVVLSGFNITIVADALRRLLSFLPRVWGIVAGAIGIVLFGILVGGGATVVRSCFMAGVALVAGLIRRDYDVSRALFFAGLIMLIENPMILLHDPSFQLSFLATMGLILLASSIESRLSFLPDFFGMRGIVAATLSTQIFVSPYILYMMGQLSIVGVVVNILVLPFIPVTMLAVFLTGATGFVSVIVSQVVGWGAHLMLAYELFMVEHFARLPFAAVFLPQFSGLWVAGFYVVFFIIYILLKRRPVANRTKQP